ncbi:hypothetical protein MKEN_00164000 [Mycena kentingensis (nom. inval.)]|nr:hypothetical protein MKEN_00164000 [Mycena kentingensis (nom. inval.)]
MEHPRTRTPRKPPSLDPSVLPYCTASGGRAELSPSFTEFDPRSLPQDPDLSRTRGGGGQRTTHSYSFPRTEFPPGAVGVDLPPPTTTATGLRIKFVNPSLYATNSNPRYRFESSVGPTGIRRINIIPVGRIIDGGGPVAAEGGSVAAEAGDDGDEAGDTVSEAAESFYTAQEYVD